tara:strand:- start:183 stop:599 length:417 start_codon:yes stop_codon:yes gene_type:complete
MDADKFNNQLATQIEQYDNENSFRTNQWNAQNAQAVEQSNVNWRRQANTINTAAQNASNQQEAQFAFNLTATEQNFVWQSLRDTAAHNQQSSQNTKERAMQVLSSVYGNTDLMASSSGRVLAANLANALEKLAFGKII